MLRRPTLIPTLDATGLVLEGLIEHVRVWQADSLDTADVLRSARAEIDQQQRRLEGPQAALQFVDDFADFFVGLAADFDRVLEQLEAGVIAGQDEALLKIAAAAAAREQQVLAFRDKWLNRPLPYEDMRPLLNRISIAPRDQLLDYHHLREAALHLQPPAPPAPPDSPEAPPPSADRSAAARPDDERVIGRRDLLSKLFKRDR